MWLCEHYLVDFVTRTCLLEVVYMLVRYFDDSVAVTQLSMLL